MSALGKTMSQMFGGPAIKATGTAMAGGAAAGLGVNFVDAGREKLVAAIPSLSFLGGVWGKVLSATITALVVGGLVRSKSALAAAGSSGAMGMLITQQLLGEFAPNVHIGLSGSIAQSGVGSFLDRLDNAGRRMLAGTLQQQRSGRLAGSVAQALGGTVYGGQPVPAARVGARSL